MTKEDQVYGDWLDLFGSDEIGDTDPGIAADLHAMHDAAASSHHAQGCIGAPGHTEICPTDTPPERL